MLNEPKDFLIAQLETILQLAGNDDELINKPISQQIHILMLSTRSIRNITGKTSPYYRQVEKIVDGPVDECSKVLQIVGVVKVLRDDIEAGKLHP